MTTTRRSTARATRRSISLAPNVLDDSPTPPPAEPDPQPTADPVDADPAPAKPKARPRKAAGPADADAAPAEPRARRVSTAAAADAETAAAKAKTRAPRRTKALAEPQMVTPTLRDGEQTFAEEVTKITVNLPVSLHQRLSGLVMHAQWYGQPEGVYSLTDVVLQAVNRSVTEYEQQLNGGKSFPAPKFLPRGRRRKVAQPMPASD